MLMIHLMILLILALICLIIGSYTDIKTREVPDWMNFSLIVSAISIRLISSVLNSNYKIILDGMIGLIIGVILGYLMYYTGQWGGGDSKILMALGAVFGMPISITPIPLILIFLINLLFISAIYGMCYSIYLGIKHNNRFFRNYQILRNKYEVQFTTRLLNVLGIFSIILSIIFIDTKNLLYPTLTLIILIYITYRLFYVIKAIEKSSMYKLVDPEDLTIGEWIAKDYFDKNKNYVCGPKDLGITEKQIKKLISLKKDKVINNVQIKVGVPFIPSFLITYIITLILGQWWTYFIK